MVERTGFPVEVGNDTLLSSRPPNPCLAYQAGAGSGSPVGMKERDFVAARSKNRHDPRKWKPKGFRYGGGFWIGFGSGERENRHGVDGG